MLIWWSLWGRFVFDRHLCDFDLIFISPLYVGCSSCALPISSGFSCWFSVGIWRFSMLIWWSLWGKFVFDRHLCDFDLVFISPLYVGCSSCALPISSGFSCWFSVGIWRTSVVWYTKMYSRRNMFMWCYLNMVIQTESTSWVQLSWRITSSIPKSQ
jgi:hypothetical protein